MKVRHFTCCRQRSGITGAFLFWVFLAVAVAAWSQAPTRQQPSVSKLTLSQIEDLVSHGVPDSTMHMEILRHGLAFIPDPGTLESLGRKGAGPQTLAAIETFFRNSTPINSKSSGAAAEILPRNFLPPVGYVNDFAHILSPEAVARLDRVCGQLDHSRANAQVFIVTIYTLNRADTADFAKELFNKWGIGHKGSNRGVLVLLAVNDHKDRITVGYGMESILTDAKAAEILREAAPRFHANDFDGGVTQIVGRVVRVIADDANVKLGDA